MKKLDFTLAFLLGVLSGSAIVLNLLKFSNKIIPYNKDVQEGYVISKHLEIECINADKEHRGKTRIRYKGNYYWLALDSLGEPQIKPCDYTHQK